MKKLLSLYHPRSIRSLVYMLQASEYSVRDYLRWFKRASDFVNVEQRKQLTLTSKALILLAIGWGIVFAVLLAVIFSFVLFPLPWSLLLALVIITLMPFMLAYGLALAVWKLHIVQFPLEYILVKQAERTLARHKGVKIAVAGSYGKTSMREILKTVLSEGKKVAAPPSSYNTSLGIAKFVRRLKGDEEVLIFELGEYYPGDVRKLTRIISPEWGVITGINEAHLEKFKTLERTASTIFELAEEVSMENLYVNGENAMCRARARSGNVLFTHEGAGSWRVSGAATNLSGTTFEMSNGKDSFLATSKLLGLHMLGALSVAIDLGARLGLTKEQLQKGISKTKPFEHRLEPKSFGEGVVLLDDSYNGNPDGVRAVIAFLETLSGRRFYVTPGLVEAGQRVKEVHEEIGRELAGARIEKVVLIRNSVTPHIKTGLKAGGFKGELLEYDDMPGCLNALRSLTLPGDIVLIQNDWPDQYA